MHHLVPSHFNWILLVVTADSCSLALNVTGHKRLAISYTRTTLSLPCRYGYLDDRCIINQRLVRVLLLMYAKIDSGLVAEASLTGDFSRSDALSW